MRKSRISQAKQDRLVGHVIAGTATRTAARLVDAHRDTSAYYFHRLGEIIAKELDAESAAMFGGEIEADESYFGGRRKGKRGRDAAEQIIVIYILKPSRKAYSRVIPDAKGCTLMPIVERKVVPDSIVYSDSRQDYSALDVSSFKHFKMNHSELFADARNHINGIENFWNQAKRHMRKFNSVPKEHSGLFLKECDWRFNTPDPKRQLIALRQWVRDNIG